MFVEKLRDVEIWLLRCGFGDPALVAVDVDVGHGEGLGGEAEGVRHEGEKSVGGIRGEEEWLWGNRRLGDRVGIGTVGRRHFESLVWWNWGIVDT